MRARLEPEQMYPAGRSDIRTSWITTPDGVRLRVAESGPTDGAPVLLLHGWCECVYTFRHALEALPRAGFHAIAFDLRGCGLSEKPAASGAYSAKALRGDIRFLIETLCGGRAAVIGHSLGGGLALDAGITLGDAVGAIVAINPTGFATPLGILPLRLTPRLVAHLAARAGQQLIPRSLVHLILRLAYADASRIEARTIDEYWSATGSPHFVRSALAIAREYDWSPLPEAETKSLITPTMVILGNHDRLLSGGEKADRLLPRSTVARFEGGHCVQEEHPTEVFSRVIEFLANPRSIK
jgi:pimeloyl-ACP methyl ester carboxylesterase